MPANLHCRVCMRYLEMSPQNHSREFVCVLMFLDMRVGADVRVFKPADMGGRVDVCVDVWALRCVRALPGDVPPVPL